LIQIELLVGIAVTSVLAGKRLPAQFKARTKADGIYCLDDLKSMQPAWSLYAGDNHGFIQGTRSSEIGPRSRVSGRLNVQDKAQ
jgi:hypothetical protein